jgi:hypothetical protein
LQELRAMVIAIRNGAAPIPPKKPAPEPIALAPPVAREPSFKYQPLRGGPTFKGATMRSLKVDHALAAAGFREIDRSGDERVVTTEGPRL